MGKLSKFLTVNVEEIYEEEERMLFVFKDSAPLPHGSFRVVRD
jgi:hypothetical protein